MGFEVPGKGTTISELVRMYPDEESARRWFEQLLWSDGKRACPECGSDRTYECSHQTMPYRCRACRRYFSIRTGTVMAASPLSLRKWAFAIHLDVGFANGASSMKLHRDLGVTQKSAWLMQRRIREAFSAQRGSSLSGGRELQRSRTMSTSRPAEVLT